MVLPNIRVKDLTDKIYLYSEFIEMYRRSKTILSMLPKIFNKVYVPNALVLFTLIYINC